MYQSIYGDFLHGSLDVALSRAEKARKDFSSAAPRIDPAWGMKFCLLEAEILLQQRHLDDVISLLADDASFPSTGDLAIKRNLIRGLANFYLSRTQAADAQLREARRLAESAKSRLIGDVLQAEAIVQLDSGNWDTASEKFRGSLSVARDHGDLLQQAVDLVDLGFASLQTGHFDQSITLSQEAVNFATSIQARTYIHFALGNIGWAYQNLGDFEYALSNFQAAEQQAKEIGMARVRVIWLQDAGLAAYRLGKLDEARKYDEEALQAALQLPAADELDEIVNIETNLALLLHEQGQYDAAQTYSDKALLAAQGSRDNKVIAYAEFLQGMIATHQAGREDAERRLLHAGQLTPDPETRMEIENALANLYGKRHESVRAELWYRRSIDTFEQNRSSVQNEALRLSSFAYGDTVYRDYAGFLIDAHRPMEALKLLDRSRARTLDEGLGFVDDKPAAQGKDVWDAGAVARKLDACILFYSLGLEKSYLWAITAHDTRLFTLPKQKDLQSLVEEYHRVIKKSGDPLQSANPAALALYDALIKPAAAMIPKDSKVFLIPDGILHALNFETLLTPTADGFKYWIEDVAVTTTSSIRMLARSNAISAQATSAQPTTRDLLLIGNPTPAGTEFEALPNASAEIERIQRHFPPDSQTVVTQAFAVPAVYTTSGPEQFKYIHFVSHGTASRLSPLDSAVVLSPTPKNPEEFKLYARDIVQHPLHARLVTISACYGSGTRAYAGEGLVGLAWAFLRAGSHNVISALWEVNDASTPLLMDRLYGEIAAGKTPDAALRSAKLSLIHSASVYRKPLYWGAFQLYAGS